MATARKKATAKTKPAPEVVEEELELDEVEEDEVEEAPKKKSAAQEVTFGVADIAALISEGKDKPITTRELRTLIRKMARDGSGRINREIIPGNRVRYDWSGPNDPEVKAIIKAFNSGELEADKQEKLKALKDRKAAQKAEAEAAKAAEVDEDEDLDLEDED